ncbi:hypothetical protein Mal64_09940 [Pseudobythopirellula maris]|uniref:Bacteriophage N4 adsorption protein B n=1 Tax=Pseudobythopirellula maris TaxID=2527991 RepID=A0A5C5ZTM9_9BACT|nr:hypothetical protein [Pseudobythopirellula maris]TWT90600.1 hypothetical protein Mal64_09940 [Pseudobythopirellula maris]
MKFGIYLMHRGLITAQQLVEAIEEQQDLQVPLGQLAIEEEKLSVRQVFRILRTQLDDLREPFGETAISQGLLTRTDLAELMLVQMSRRMPIDQILVRQGSITQDELEKALHAFRLERRGMAVECAEHAGSCDRLSEQSVRVMHALEPDIAGSL